MPLTDTRTCSCSRPDGCRIDLRPRDHCKLSDSSTQTTYTSCYTDQGTQTIEEEREKEEKEKAIETVVMNESSSKTREIQIPAPTPAALAPKPAPAPILKTKPTSTTLSAPASEQSTSKSKSTPPPSAPAPAPVRRGRLFRTRSGNLVSAQELRRRRRQASASTQEQRDLDAALLTMILEEIGQVSVVNMCMDEAGRWRIQRPLATEIENSCYQHPIDPLSE